MTQSGSSVAWRRRIKIKFKSNHIWFLNSLKTYLHYSFFSSFIEAATVTTRAMDLTSHGAEPGWTPVGSGPGVKSSLIQKGGSPEQSEWSFLPLGQTCAWGALYTPEAGFWKRGQNQLTISLISQEQYPRWEILSLCNIFQSRLLSVCLQISCHPQKQLLLFSSWSSTGCTWRNNPQHLHFPPEVTGALDYSLSLLTTEISFFKGTMTVFKTPNTTVMSYPIYLYIFAKTGKTHNR